MRASVAALRPPPVLAETECDGPPGGLELASVAFGAEAPMRMTRTASLDRFSDVSDPLHDGADNSAGGMKLRARWFLATSGFGHVIEVINIVLSVVACMMYLHLTYIRGNVPLEMVVADSTMLAFFACHAILHLGLAPNGLRHIQTTWFWLNLVSVIPPISSVWIQSAPPLAAKLARACVTLRLVHAIHLVGYVKHDVHRQVLRITVVVMALTFGAAAIIEVVENHVPFQPNDLPISHRPQLTLPNAYYFVITTLTTGKTAPCCRLNRLEERAREGEGRESWQECQGTTLQPAPTRSEQPVHGSLSRIWLSFRAFRNECASRVGSLLLLLPSMFHWSFPQWGLAISLP